MFVKILFIVVIFFSYSFSSYEKVKIGHIDSYYYDKITKEELITIIKEIENIFESQLGFNVFDYSATGKPIDLIYMPPSQKKRSFENSVKDSHIKKKKLKSLSERIVKKQNNLNKNQEELQTYYSSLNQDINSFNNHIAKLQKQEISSKEQYNKIRKQVDEQKRKLKSKKDRFNQKKIKYNSSVKTYNQLTLQYNTLVKQFNRLQRKIEVLSRSLTEVKGVAKGYTQTVFETFEKNGRTYTTKVKKNYMEKIEIYNFESKEQLKTVLAHELAHLVGVGHINVNRALMNPILQENQIKNLKLTSEDIEAFKKSF